MAMHCNIVAQCLDCLPREGLIDGLGFLQADDVRRPLGEPGGQVLDSLLDRIDVPGGDAHGGLWGSYDGRH
jgi:hypothetical protein